MDISQRIEDEVKKLPDNWIILVESSPKNVTDVGTSVVKYMNQKDFSGTILSSTRPYDNLLSLYKTSQISMDNIFVLDVITKSQRRDIEESDGVIFLDNASCLTDISISLNTFMKMGGEKRFVLIDSLNSMLIHNDNEVFTRFIHSILTKMRINNVSGILLFIEDNTKKELRAEIAQLCDRVIKV